MQAEDLGCTQFGTPFPKPRTPAAEQSSIPAIITTIVSAYLPVHYYLYTSLVVFSVFANFTILLVLTRKEMRSVGVNVTMMLIAVCDFTCSISAAIQQFLRSTDIYVSYFSAYTRITVDYFSIAFHAYSLYLAVAMAFCRAMSLSLSNVNRDNWQSPKYAIRIGLLLCPPIFATSSFALLLNTVTESEERGVYTDVSALTLMNHCLFLKLTLFISGFCFKVAYFRDLMTHSLFQALPCAMMLFFSLFLLSKIGEGQKRSVSLMSSQHGKNNQIERSTRFIQFILVVFLLTEIPQGVFSIIGGLFVIDYINYYQTLASIMNLLGIFNTTTSFIVYSSLSSKFRKLFVQIFIPNAIIEKMSKKSSIVVQPKPSSSLTN